MSPRKIHLVSEETASAAEELSGQAIQRDLMGMFKLGHKKEEEVPVISEQEHYDPIPEQEVHTPGTKTITLDDDSFGRLDK